VEPAQVRADFDRLATLAGDAWDHNRHYHGWLLAQVPRGCGDALEVGCGSGAFARALAGRARRVLALDLSPEMIRVARAHAPPRANLEYRVADAAETELPHERFDCIASLATLHHLAPRDALARLRDALRPGGVLLVLDLVSDPGPGGLARSALAVAASGLVRLARNGRQREPRALREAWAEHVRGERYPTLEEARALACELLPGARVRRHLFWRYSIVWRKPGRDAGGMA
jgi:SAM-dependent methyltransferase